MVKANTPEALGKSNKMLILNHLRENGNMSRAELCRNLGISFPAISSSVKSLLEADFIKEVGQGDNSLGRKSTLLAFNQSRGYVVGLDLGRFWIRITVADLLGQPVASTKKETDVTNGGRGLIDEVVGLIDEVVSAAKIEALKVLCVCIGIPGVINGDGICLAPFLPNISIGDLKISVTKDYQSHVIVENGTNLGAIGEKWRGGGQEYRNFVFMNYGVGVGAAVIIGGKLYTGTNNAAGEIGFMISGTNDLRSKFEEIGVLENIIARDKIQKHISHGNFREEVDGLIKKYKQKEKGEQKLLDEICLSIGVSLINISAILDLEAIIISGGMGTSIGKLFVEKWKVMLENHVPFPPKIIFSDLDNQEGVLGAISVGIERLHKNPDELFA